MHKLFDVSQLTECNETVYRSHRYIVRFKKLLKQRLIKLKRTFLVLDFSKLTDSEQIFRKTFSAIQVFDNIWLMTLKI